MSSDPPSIAVQIGEAVLHMDNLGGMRIRVRHPGNTWPRFEVSCWPPSSNWPFECNAGSIALAILGLNDKLVEAGL